MISFMDSRPRINRRKTDRVVAGVAGALADRLGVGAAYVRAAFLTLTTIWGLGVVAYVALWLYAYDDVADTEPRSIEPRQKFGLALVFTGMMWVLELLGWWPRGALVFTVATTAFGSAALIDRTGPRPLAALFDPSVGRAGRLRVILGAGLVVAGIAIFASAAGPAIEIASVVLAIVVTAIGVVVGFGPLVRRLAGDLTRERNERIRQEERAEMAAHLHDSVLQTLALIQRTDDPGRIAMLARHQETELRDWLFGTTPLDGVDLVSTALRRAARKVEEDHQVPVEIVVVGDHPLDPSSAALVGAASEAMVNAAKHSGSGRVSLFFEATEDDLSVYVTDQGKGFDADAVASDRRGIAESIVARVRKAGGSASVASDPGEGTEVHLTLPVAR